MESIEFFQVFIIIIILIVTLFYIYFRSLTFSSSSSSAAAAAAADTDIPPLQEKYDVFLSFRGEDTRDTFTSHLHKALRGKNIETYIDNRLERGDEIAPALLKAIERSKIALVIFSKDYASSTWCLKELVHILGRKKSHGQIVIPIFYRIDPSDVRKQKGTYELGGLLWRLKKRFKGSMDEVADWRAALEEAANISGFHDSSKTGSEADFVEKVVQDVLTKLNRESSSDLRGLFGIQRKIEKIESLLCLDSPCVCCVGIWGMGGIGKTTLATAVFNRLASKFEAYCFLANVREKSEQTGGLNQLLNELVREILKDKDINIGTLSIGLTSIRDRLMRTKALIVLDDVNDPSQLEVLVGDDDRFCQGSRIIMTARDKGVLEQKVDHDKIYKVEDLSSGEALQLFHSHAFRNKSPTTEYNALSRKVVQYINGIPLGLKVMGSLFLGCKSKQEWEDQLDKLKRFPSEQVNKVLRVSYDGLEENEKEIFLDIACFHKGYKRSHVKEFLDSRGFFGEVGIKVLVDRSLISISNDLQDMFSYMEKKMWKDIQTQGRIEMHDLVQEMGLSIAREQRIEEHSRLFNAEDVHQVLTNNQLYSALDCQRNGHVQAISFDLFKIEKLHLEHANFEKMYQLKCLRVYGSIPLIVPLDFPNSLSYLHWPGYPLKSLPSNFSPANLLVLCMPFSQVGAQLWNEDQSPVNLKWICLSKCEHLTKVPNLSRSKKIEHIDLDGCVYLQEIPSYFQHLGKLTYLCLAKCKYLKNLPEMPCNLEFLNLEGTAIEELPSSVWSHEKISHLDITFCKRLKSLPSNTCKLKLSSTFSLEGCKSLREFWELPSDTKRLNLFCKNLVSLPTNIWKLKSLESLDLSHCYDFQNFPGISEVMEHLEFLNLHSTMVKELPPLIGNLVALRELDLSWTEIKTIPASIKQAAQLSRLCLNYCQSFESLPELPLSLKSLDLSECFKFQNFPEFSEAMEHLEFLNLSRTSVKEVPPSIGNLVALRKLDLGRCKKLEGVTDYLFYLTSLQEINLRWTKIKSIPASIKQTAQLSRLSLRHCKSLESLPELPPLLQCLKAHGCTSLKTVSSSSTAITQGREEYIFSRGLHEKHIFSDCPKLDENAQSNIMGDAQLRIMRMAIALSKFKEDKIEEKIEKVSISACYDSDDEYESEKEFFGKRSLVAVRCWGYEIPKWFSHRSEGPSIKIELPRDWFSTDFLGFALSLVVAYKSYHPWEMKMEIGCKYNFKTSNGDSHEVQVNHPLFNGPSGPMEVSSVANNPRFTEVFVWWYNHVFEEVVEEARSPTAFYNRFTEVNVKMWCQPFRKVKKCGICLLYGKDAEMIKQRALYAQDA
ncbi:hypothetical protein ACE6H2_026810 [Prunus campanulata]